MGVSKEMFQQIISRSQKLCTPEADGIIESKKRNTDLYDPDPDSFGSPDDSFFLAETYESEAPVMSTGNFSQEAAANSKLPDFIKKSMMEENIDVSSMDPNRSVLDSMDIPARKKPVSPRKAQKAPVSEGASPSVDYGIIKAIINECLDEKLASFAKKNLNEGTLATIGLKAGKIQLVDNQGRLFSSNLEYKGNIND